MSIGRYQIGVFLNFVYLKVVFYKLLINISSLIYSMLSKLSILFLNMNTEFLNLLLKRSNDAKIKHKRYMHAFDFKDIDKFHAYVTQNPAFHANFVVHDVIDKYKDLIVSP